MTPLDARLHAAFRAEEDAGLRLVTRVRLVATGVIAVWTVVENRGPGGAYYTAVALLFGLLGTLPIALRAAGARGAWPRYLLALLDAVVFTTAVLIPNPLAPDDLPVQLHLRWGNELYLFTLLALASFGCSPALVIWTGVVLSAAWSVGVLAILLRPESWGYRPPSYWAALRGEELLAVILDPHRVDIALWGRIVVLLLVLSAAFAIVVQRARRLVARQVVAERARANLQRYFSPNVVEELAAADEPLSSTRQQVVAVLFADIVGFTGLTADAPPEAVIRLLRGFHRRMVQAVFEHGGTLDKYLGDGVMVSFGTPHVRSDDAARALRCARSMLATVDAWSAERTRDGLPPVRIGVGLHLGPVVLGDVGDERHLEFAVLGNTVNVASRLQELTRTLGTRLLVSEDVIREAGEAAPEVAGLRRRGPAPVRGLDHPVTVWTEADASPAAGT